LLNAAQKTLSRYEIINLPQELENDFPKAFTKYLTMTVFTKESNEEFNKFVEAISKIYANKGNVSINDLFAFTKTYLSKAHKLNAIKNSLLLGLSNVKSILKVEDLNTRKIKSTTRTSASMNEIYELLQEHYEYFKMFLFERST
jgi:hypothetical protein